MSQRNLLFLYQLFAHINKVWMNCNNLALLVDFGTNNIYSFSTEPWVVISNDIFQWLIIYKYYQQLSVVSQHFHLLEIPKTNVWCLLQRIDLWLYEFQSVPIALCCLDTPLIIYVLRRVRIWGWRSKMIKQYFNVYALRRVHCAGYATALLSLYLKPIGLVYKSLQVK